MEPGLESKDKVLVYKVPKPKVGDIILVEHKQTKIIKRLVAKGGDTIEIKDDELLINDEKVSEPYIKEDMYSEDFPKTTLDDDELFVLGDNRNNSSDSRHYGIFTEDQYFGKAVFYFRKISDIGKIKSETPK